MLATYFIFFVTAAYKMRTGNVEYCVGYYFYNIGGDKCEP